MLPLFFTGRAAVAHEHDHRGDVVLAVRLHRLVAHGLARGRNVAARLLHDLGRQQAHLRVREVALGDAVAHDEQEVGGVALKVAHLGVARHGAVLLPRAARPLAVGVAEAPGHGQVAVHARAAARPAVLHRAAAAVDALPLRGHVRLVVVGQAGVGAAAVHDGAVRPAQQHAAVPGVDHVQLVLAARVLGRPHDAHGRRGAARLLRGQELGVDGEHHLLGAGVVHRHALRRQLLVQALGAPRGAGLPAVPVQHAEIPHPVRRVDDVGVLHRVAEA